MEEESDEGHKSEWYTVRKDEKQDDEELGTYHHCSRQFTMLNTVATTVVVN